MKYARIQSGVVAEIIEAYVTTEADRPPMPAALPEGATADEQAAYEEALRGHNEFFVGEVPMEQRFAPEVVATLVVIPEGLEVAQQWQYKDGGFLPPLAPSPPPYTAEQILAERDARLRDAATRIAPLQDAVDLGEATAEETASLTAWKQYRVALNRITQQSGYPGSVTWPVAPN